MARITWLGEAECLWNEVTFPPGVPVEIKSPGSSVVICALACAAISGAVQSACLGAQTFT